MRANFWQKHGRTAALSAFGLIIAVGFLAYTGGFSNLAKIFGSKAGTELIFAGANNLSGNHDAENWVHGTVDTELAGGAVVPAPLVSFNGTGTFTGFTGIPGYSVGQSADESFVMPTVTSLDPTQDTFSSHTYYSPGLDLGTNALNFNQITIDAYLPDTATVQFGYRTATGLTELTGAAWTNLAPTFTILPTNENIKSAGVAVSGLSQYVQFSVNFASFEPTNRPAVYGWIFDVGALDGGVNVSEAPSQRNLTMTYSTTNAPANAEIKIVGSNPDALPVFRASGINLTALPQYVANAVLAPGAYAVVVTSPTTLTKTVAFDLGTEGALEIALGDFTAGTGEAPNSDSGSADLNGDGSVDSLDASILLDQIANP